MLTPRSLGRMIAWLIASPIMYCGACGTTLDEGDGVNSQEQPGAVAVAADDQLGEKDVVVEIAVADVAVGESIIAHLKVRAVGRDIRLLRAERLFRYSAFETQVVDPQGKEIAGGNPRVDPPTGLAAEDTFTLREGQTFEADVPLFRSLPEAGGYRVTVWYRPLWIKGPTVKREMAVAAGVTKRDVSDYSVRIIDRVPFSFS